MVCTANICRSPVAEALLRDRLCRAGLVEWRVSSGATWAVGPYRAAGFSIDLMAERGVDISGHRAKHVRKASIEAADLVLCLDRSHVEELRRDFPNFRERIHLLSEMSGHAHGVEDPYGGSLQAYRAMVSEIDGLIEAGFDRIIRLAGAVEGQETPTTI